MADWTPSTNADDGDDLRTLLARILAALNALSGS